MIIQVLGVDPSMANWGMSLCDLDLTNNQIQIRELCLLKTETGKNKRVRKNSDDLERAKILHAGFNEFASKVKLCFVEVPHGSQSARAMASYGMCIGLLASSPVPLFELTERELKLATTGDHKCSKAEMINWVTERHTEGKWPTRAGKIVTSKCEHLCDATAAVHAGTQTDEFKRMVSWMTQVRAA